ncbi:ABC transporter permease [Pseudovibrio flavus]|uniref:ABC transporter permease n=1 Tax=Pseudovibrio flavus TaxID=2529854 RepID=UPI003529B88C
MSFGRVLAGFSISASCALLLAACHHSMPRLEQFMSVPLEAIRVIPPLATVPVLILWLGIGEASKLAIIVLASFFPVYLSTRTALSLCDPKLMQMAHTLRLTKLERLRLITVPQILPGAMTGLRLGFGYAWRALVGAEMIAAAAGLGYLIIDSEELARTDRVFVGIATIAITGLLLDAIFRRLLPQDKRQGALKGVF